MANKKALTLDQLKTSLDTVKTWSSNEINNATKDKADKETVLLKDNTTEFTPANDYEPATKKYVDTENRLAKRFIFDSDDNIVGVKIKDQVNNYNYIMCMRNGTLATTCAAKSIAVTTNPTKMTYYDRDGIDTTGMIVTATCEDDTTREITNYTCDNVVTTDNTVFTINYTEGGDVFSDSINVTVNAFDPAAVLIDFEYTDNGDGTYTLTKWKETYNGEASTEMIIPNNSHIIVSVNEDA